MFTVLRHIFRVAAHDMISGMPIQEKHLPGEAFGETDIIGIEAGDINASCHPQAGIQGIGDPFIFLDEEADAGIGKTSDDGEGVVEGAIIDDQQFEIVK